MSLNIAKEIKRKRTPYIIAGPCSAETEEQLFAVCDELAKNPYVSILRAGIWKPRTRPDSFEGIGEKAIPWLVEAGKMNNLPVTTEVANAKHVETALNAGINILWIGARTTANPFAVQDIADALKGTSTSVMVKNPINPDLMLWIGAFERLKNAGIEDLIAIHRGFSIYNHSKYRNIPNWEIPIALKEHLDDIPILCDPSHISGKVEGLLEVAQKSMDLNFSGLMIETHTNPTQAWSDSKQQITPSALRILIENLKLRKNKLTKEELSFIEIMRDKISTLDDQLFNLLSERMLLSEEVGLYKRENEITILQQEHWKKIIDKRMSQSDELQLTPTFIRSVMDAIHQESIRHQTKVMNPEISIAVGNKK